MRKSLRITLLSAVIGTSLAVAAATSANVVESGKTVLKGDPDTLEALADMSIAVEPTGQAEFTQSGIKFPVTGGDMITNDGVKGLVVHAGGLMLSRDDGATVKFRRIGIIVGNTKARLFARANGTEMRFMTLKNGETSATDTSFRIKDAEATLSKAAAELMSEVFDFPFRRGIPVGTTTTKATIGAQVEE